MPNPDSYEKGGIATLAWLLLRDVLSDRKYQGSYTNTKRVGFASGVLRARPAPQLELGFRVHERRKVRISDGNRGVEAMESIRHAEFVLPTRRQPIHPYRRERALRGRECEKNRAHLVLPEPYCAEVSPRRLHLD